jgi:phage terminase large subunit-like protein
VLHNGTMIKLFSADEPERLRGPQHHRAWCDELGAWRYPEKWDQLQLGLRLGKDP